jgi:hypothetical protein
VDGAPCILNAECRYANRYVAGYLHPCGGRRGKQFLGAATRCRRPIQPTRERYEGMSEYITGIGVFALVLSPLCVPIVVTIVDAVRRRLSRRTDAAAVPFDSELGDFRLYAVQTP